MPNERVSMSKLKQLIGLQSSNLSVRAMSRALGLSVGAVSKYLRALRSCGIDAGEAEKLSEVELEQRVFGAAPLKAVTRAAPDCAGIHHELKRHRHVTLQLLWEEYAGQHGAVAYQRSAFCQIYRDWEKRLKRSMRQRHFAGEKLFIDYAGRTVPIHGYGGAQEFQAHLFITASVIVARGTSAIQTAQRWAAAARYNRTCFGSKAPMSRQARVYFTK
jgi:transposase